VYHPAESNVSLEDNSSALRRIKGVSVSAAGFVGETERGPTIPMLVTSWAEYQRIFGGFLDEPPFSSPNCNLPYAARGFFENGGLQLYVSRILAGTEIGVGLDGLMAIPDASLIAAPDEVIDPGITDEVLDCCEEAGNRFAILAAATPEDELSALSNHRDSSFGALYHPRVRVEAAHRPEGSTFVTPVGHVAGIYARSDMQHGVHKAPANEPVLGILEGDRRTGAPLSQVPSDADLEALNRGGVNVIRDLRVTGRGLRVWGARTMSSDPQWRYVNIRRLVIFIETSIDQGTRWAVCERNNEATWSAVRSSVTTFLTVIWRSSALLGNVPEQAFFVRCDRSTMTQEDLDNGRLIVEVGVAPLKPAEFVILRIGQWVRRDP
jgi:uncharacterized protein